jgi:hypothetical protein
MDCSMRSTATIQKAPFPGPVPSASRCVPRPLVRSTATSRRQIVNEELDVQTREPRARRGRIGEPRVLRREWGLPLRARAYAVNQPTCPVHLASL